MRFTIIGKDVEGGRARFLWAALNTIGHEAVLVDSDTIADRFTGEEYKDIVNKGKPIELHDIDECQDADAILVIHNPLQYEWLEPISLPWLDTHLNPRKRPLIAFWHVEPYFRPSITPDLLLAADTNVQGHWLQWWRWEYAHVTRTALFPFACPPVGWVDPEVVHSGLHLLANRSFNNPGTGKASYFERTALRDRNAIAERLEHEGKLTVHTYPINPWRAYIRQLAGCKSVLVVPGGGCQFNQQFSECMALGIRPVVAIEEPEQVAGYRRIGLLSGVHYEELDHYLRPERRPLSAADEATISRVIAEWAERNSYAARARQLVAEIEKTRETIANNERFAAAAERGTVQGR